MHAVLRIIVVAGLLAVLAGPAASGAQAQGGWSLTVTPTSAVERTGRTVSLTATPSNADPRRADAVLRYVVEGANPQAGSVPLPAGADPTRVLPFLGTAFGTDRVQVFVAASATGPAISNVVNVTLTWTAWTLALAPPETTAATGTTVRLRLFPEYHGPPLSGAPSLFRYAVTGPNMHVGSAQFAPDGASTIPVFGGQPGTDTVTAFVDGDSNGEQDPDERTGQATVTWVGPPIAEGQDQAGVPQPGRSVVTGIERGRIRVRLPGSTTFVDLQPGQQLPLGTVVDARRGRIRITSASNSSGGTQTGVFFAGVFRVGELRRGARRITTLDLAGANPSPARIRRGIRASAASILAEAAARPRRRRLWGDARGNFRSRGNFSAATVRGTRWLVEDRCAYTLTRVRSGRVTVRDYVRRRTVRLRAGQGYRAYANKRRRCGRARR